MEKITVEEMKRLLKVPKDHLYKKEIEEMESGEVLKIHWSEWTMKTPPAPYYSSRKVKSVKIKMRGEYFYIIKV